MSQQKTSPPSLPPNIKSSPKKEAEKREIRRDDKRLKDSTKQKPPPITEQSNSSLKDQQSKQGTQKTDGLLQKEQSAKNPNSNPSSNDKIETTNQKINSSLNENPAASSSERELTVPYAASTRKARSVSIGLSHPITFGYAKPKPTQNNTNAGQAKSNLSSKFSSTTERVMKDVPEPTREVLTMNQVYKKDNKIDCDLLKEHFRKEGRIAIDVAKRIINSAKELFKAEPNVLDLKTPLNICGDIHGQYYDLINILDNVGGSPAEFQYLFLGDYVDRGCFSCEVCFLLFSYKINYPNTFFMIRGNHECRVLTDFFNFKAECLYKYNEEIYQMFCATFDCLPIAATINAKFGKFLCMHGGLSPSIDTIEDIRKLNRFTEPPESGPLCDLLWSDPMKEEMAEDMSDEEWLNMYFQHNPERGCSYVFGYKAVEDFLEKNDLIAIIRAHEVQADGFYLHRFLLSEESRSFPPVITIFSAPNYCDFYNNRAALLHLAENKFELKQVDCVEHPYWLPDFMNAINWSVPFIYEQISDFFMNIVKLGIQEDIEEEAKEQSTDSKEAKSKTPLSDEERKKAKLQALERIMKLMKQLREERDKSLRLNPQFCTKEGGKRLTFKEAKTTDLANERHPNSIPLRRRTKSF
jgi:serine/threonine-protein phosphatase 2B catalytic subunit